MGYEKTSGPRSIETESWYPPWTTFGVIGNVTSTTSPAFHVRSILAKPACSVDGCACPLTLTAVPFAHAGIRNRSGNLISAAGFTVMRTVSAKRIIRLLHHVHGGLAHPGADLAWRVRGCNQPTVGRRHPQAGGELRPALMEVRRAAAEVRFQTVEVGLRPVGRPRLPVQATSTWLGSWLYWCAHISSVNVPGSALNAICSRRSPSDASPRMARDCSSENIVSTTVHSSEPCDGFFPRSARRRRTCRSAGHDTCPVPSASAHSPRRSSRARDDRPHRRRLQRLAIVHPVRCKCVIAKPVVLRPA